MRRGRHTLPGNRGLVCALAAGAILCGAVPAAAAASVPGPALGLTLPSFVRDIDFILLVDGVQVPVELYKGESAGAIVLVSPRFPQPLLLRAEVLWSIDPAAIRKHPDATLTLAADAALTRRGTFMVTSDGVSFVLDGHQGSLRHLDVPPLLGLRRLDEVTAHNPEYLASATAETPNPRAVAALRRERRPVAVRIYYGSWCGHCRMLVPHAVKLEQELRGTSVRFEYFGVGNPLTDPEAKKARIFEIPTAIVSVGGREIGRVIADKDWRALEMALAELLGKASASGRGGG